VTGGKNDKKQDSSIENAKDKAGSKKMVDEE
jgi:hypothetical protein